MIEMGEICKTRGRTAILATVLFALTLWLFWPATGYDFLNFDDDRYVSGNQMVRQGLTGTSIPWALQSVYESYWLPVMWLSYMLDATLYGTEPFGFHLTNILLHALNTALLFLLLNAWTKRPWAAFFVAAFFAWHPLRVESVAWIAERKDVLSGFFLLLCLWLYKRFSLRPESGREVPAAFCMALGLMTKPILVTIPFLLLLLDYWPLERVSWTAQDIRAKSWGLLSEKVVFWALAIFFSILTYYTQSIGQAVHDSESFPWSQRLAAIPATYVFYLKKTILPARLSMIYGELHPTPLEAAGSFFLMCGLTVAVLFAGRRCRALPIGWFWFLGLLVPVIGLVRVGVVHAADRFVYLPSIGLGICIAWGASMLTTRFKRASLLLGLSGAAILLACAWQTRQVLPTWTNSLTAFKNVLNHLPRHALANNNYGEALLGAGQTEQALLHFDKALSADPRTTPFIANSALALLLLQRNDEALARLDHARTTINPQCPFLNFISGLVWMEKGQPRKAIPFLKQATLDNMARPTWQVELARAYQEAGMDAAASNELSLIEQQGWGALTSFDGLCNYYLALWQKGLGRRAWTFFERELSGAHSNNIAMLNNVAWFLATDPPAGISPASALTYALRAQELCEGDHPGVLDTLAAAYAARGQFDQAIRWSTQARELSISSGMTSLAQQIEWRRQAYQRGQAWGKNGPVAPSPDPVGQTRE